jgi:CubicO group peptidase (beta-lactamase class C family)
MLSKMRKGWMYTAIKAIIVILLGFWMLPIGKSELGDHQSLSDRRNGLQPLPEVLSYPEELAVIEKRMNRFIRRWEIPGAAMAVAKDGELKYHKGVGYAVMEDSLPVSPNHTFRLASVSKLITAAAIMKLKEEGALNLDDKVFGPEGHLPISIYGPVRDERLFLITVRHLLGHAGGWSHRYGDHLFMPHVVARELDVPLPVSEADIIRFALSKKLHFTPGVYSSYSNLGYIILGEVISRISGLPYEEYVQQAILDPLAINSMYIGHAEPEKWHTDEVHYYEVENSTQVLSAMGSGDSVPRSRGGNDIKILGAAGGWVGTAGDVLKVVLAVDGRDDFPDILSAESVSQMTDPAGIGPYGWRRSDYEGNLYRSGSFSGSVAVAYSQKNGVTWVVLMNGSSWKGADFPQYVKYEMDRTLSRISGWPEYDLFYYPYEQPTSF